MTEDDQNDLFSALDIKKTPDSDEAKSERIAAASDGEPQSAVLDDNEQNEENSDDTAPTESIELDQEEPAIIETEKKELLSGQYMRRPGAVRMGQRRNKSYTKYVRWMRVVLPLLAMGVVVILVVLSGDNDSLIKTPPNKEDVIKQSSIGRNELLAPRFDTYDKDGRPYAITAERAYQTMDSTDIIYLEKPVADSTMSDGSWVALESVAGTYNQVKQTLFLEGNVKLFHDAGYSLLTEKLDIDLDNNKAVSDVAITGQGPIGQLEASGMVADGLSNVLIFTGPAKITIYDTVKMFE
jgi:lipopolysaccharide export system protein LptC